MVLEKLFKPSSNPLIRKVEEEVLKRLEPNRENTKKFIEQQFRRPGRQNDITPGLVPIGDSGFYVTPEEPADPTDCSRYPDSPFCGGNPLSTDFANAVPIIIFNECDIGFRVDLSFGYLAMPPVAFVYRQPKCRINKEPLTYVIEDEPIELFPVKNEWSYYCWFISDVFYNEPKLKFLGGGFNYELVYRNHARHVSVEKINAGARGNEFISLKYRYTSSCSIPKVFLDLITIPDILGLFHITVDRYETNFDRTNNRRSYDSFHHRGRFDPPYYSVEAYTSTLEEEDVINSNYEETGIIYLKKGTNTHAGFPIVNYIFENLYYQLFLNSGSIGGQISISRTDQVVQEIVEENNRLNRSYEATSYEYLSSADFNNEFGYRGTIYVPPDLRSYEERVYRQSSKLIYGGYDTIDPPPLPPNYEEDDDMACCPEHTALLMKLIRKVDKLSEVVGIDEYPASLPQSLISKDEGWLGNLIPNPNTSIPNLTRLLGWYIERFDEVVGQFEIPIEIKDSDPTKPGDQPQGFKLPNVAESIGEMMTLLLQISINSELHTNMMTRTLIDNTQDKQQNFITYKLLQALTDWAGFSYKDTPKELLLHIDPTKENFDELLQTKTIKVPVAEFDEKFGLQADLMRFKKAASIIDSVYFRKVNPNEDIKEQIMKRLLGMADMLKDINVDKDQEKFEQFLRDVEVGFTNTTGVGDATKPYGEDFEDRPRFRNIKPTNNQ